MDTAELTLKLLEEFREESNRRLDELHRRFDEFRDESNRRFDQVDKQFEKMEKRFEQVEKRLERLEDKMDAVYESRDKVKITFGYQWAMASFIIAVVAAGLARLVA